MREEHNQREGGLVDHVVMELVLYFMANRSHVVCLSLNVAC